jgi:hypothetical protein
MPSYAGIREEGIKRNDWEWNSTPPYDIINNNIKVLVFKNGFSITGHARAEVCKAISLNVFNAVSNINQKDLII